jgi:hypothetical protein
MTPSGFCEEEPGGIAMQTRARAQFRRALACRAWHRMHSLLRFMRGCSAEFRLLATERATGSSTLHVLQGPGDVLTTRKGVKNARKKNESGSGIDLARDLKGCSRASKRTPLRIRPTERGERKMASTPRGGESDQPLSNRPGAAPCGCASSGLRGSRNAEPLIGTHLECFIRPQ